MPRASSRATLLAAWDTRVGKVEDRTTVTGITQGEELRSRSKGTNEVLVQLLVRNLTLSFVIQWKNCLAFPINLLSRVIPHLGAVATVHEHKRVAALHSVQQPGHRSIYKKERKIRMKEKKKGKINLQMLALVGI